MRYSALVPAHAQRDIMHETLVDELAVALARTRGGTAAGRIARDILDRDTRLQHVIGLSSAGDAVLYYQHSLRAVIEFPLTDTGLDEGLSTCELEQLGNADRIESWIARCDPDMFSWLHPRYRWIRTESHATHIREPH